MKVHRRIITHPGDRENSLSQFQQDWQSIEILSVDWCCPEAQQELTKRYQGDIGITRPSYGDVDEYPIAFCPWCGEKIEYIEEAPIRRIPIPQQKTITVYEYRDETVKTE